jgi:aspartate racemase
VVLYHRAPPILLDENLKPRLPIEPDPGLLRGASFLGGIADFLVISANAPHLIQNDIERAAGRPILSMIDVTLDDVRARGWKRIGVLGMGLPTVYTTRLDAAGLAHETLDPEARDQVDSAILSVMEGREDDAKRRFARDAVSALRARGVDGVILGCTEIPLLLGSDAEAPDLVNPAQLLAEAAVRRALE